jgi:hypothetical protein
MTRWAVPTKEENMTYRYFAAGSGQFPEDMLRYDQAKIIYAARCGVSGFVIESEREPSGRWRSFLWSTAPMKLRYPGNDPENGPATWHVKQGNVWFPLQTEPQQ